MTNKQLKEFLDIQYVRYNQSSFIDDDPISIPYQYHKKQDIEIAAFWTAMLSWGQRKTIINKMNELFGLMGNKPYDFIVNHTDEDRARFEHFKHRTFNFTDTLYFLEFLQHHYRNHDSLEDAFLKGTATKKFDTKKSLAGFHEYFFSLEYAPHRTKKHVATPLRKSSCKRLNMFLRWMVRKDAIGVDFGIWHLIPPSALMMPLDIHVQRVAQKLGLLKRTQADWLACEELTIALRKFDKNDPVKYDFALFGTGVNGYFNT